MATYNSSFQDADYGCGSNSQISAQFTLTPNGISHSEDNPAIALVAFSYTNELTLQNVKYSTTTNQDVSAWLVYTTNAEPLGATDKTFVPRQDCTTTTNSLSGTVYVPIDSTDSLVKFGARWSGFSDNPEGLAMDSLEWFNYDLSSNYTLSAPQNLQVTFPSTPEGNISASIEAWSTNPNIGGTVQENGNTWNWKVELLSASGDVLSVKEFDNNSLTPTLTADTSKVQPNTSYSMKVTVSNEYQLTTSVESPVIKSLPPAPIIRRVTFASTEAGTYTATIDWAKPRSGAEFNEWVTLNVPGYITNEQIATATNGASQTGSTEVTGIPPATPIQVILSNTSSAGQQETEQTFYTPSNVPALTASWDETRRCVTVTPTATNVSDFDMTLGYFAGDDSLGSKSGSSIQACDLNHGAGQVLYASAIPKIASHSYPEAIGFGTFPILNPIIGVAKTCNEMANIVDIVESKDGAITPRWQNGDRVHTCTMLVGGGLGAYDLKMRYVEGSGFRGVYEAGWTFTPETLATESIVYVIVPPALFVAINPLNDSTAFTSGGRPVTLTVTNGQALLTIDTRSVTNTSYLYFDIAISFPSYTPSNRALVLALQNNPLINFASTNSNSNYGRGDANLAYDVVGNTLVPFADSRLLMGSQCLPSHPGEWLYASDLQRGSNTVCPL